MELRGLNANFETVIGYLPYINLQWERSYYSYGTFVVQIEAKHYIPELAYIYTKDRPEVGMVQKIAYKSQIKGRFIELSGFFLKKLPNDKVTYPTFYCNGNLETEILRMISTYKADIPRLVVDAPTGLGGDAVWQDTGGELGAVACERLQEQQLAYYCSYNDDDGAVHFGVWQGKDRTQSQTVNSYATFSDEFANIGNVEITIDSSNFKNYGFVAGQGKGEERIVDIADASAGGYQRQVWIDSRNSRWDDSKQTEVGYRRDLVGDGLNTLATKYYVVENARISLTAALNLTDGQGDFNISMPRIVRNKNRALVYMKDYDLGDLCDTLVSDAGIDIRARIIHIREVIKRNQHTVDLELGEAVLTRTEKARL